MDFVHDSDFSFRAPIEHVASLNQPDRMAKIKNQALTSMESLEGWCSQYKASLLIDLIAMAKPEVVVEIGVWGGKSLIPMAYALRELGKGQVYGIDPWASSESIEGMNDVNREWWGGVNHQKILDGLIQKINQFGLRDQIQIVRKTSLNADPIYDIGMLHIDGNHSDECSYNDVIKWVPLVKSGGIIIFDDIYWTIDGVLSTARAVNYLDENCIRFAEIGGDNPWAIWIKP